ncbi:uncharacterized protein LOC118732457 [Rhagoletis pomonella]|uniref:uncharacterized protein LOC118732457 n=1 Tax=Rhagoletis pomonella TaxID=28610 RepID=UPI00177C238B|nr:uncharacterized protein LOC118732457 [Rhagoletis pomonella]
MPDSSASDDRVNSTFYKRKVAALTRQLDDIRTTLAPERLRELDSAALAVWLEQVERIERNFDGVQTKLEELDHMELESSARSDFFRAYADIKTSIVKEQNERQVNEKRQSSTARQFSLDEPSSFIITQPKSRLPVLQIPKFSGSYIDWPDFYSMFCTVVDKDSDLTNIEKFQHLRSSLTTSALDTIRSLEIKDENYKTALELLVHRFDNKRLNFQAHIKEIFALQRIEPGAVAKLRELSDKVNAHLRALQTMATKEQLSDCMLIHLICSKLDISSQTKWEEETPTNIIPTWDSMARFLEKRCQRLESVEEIRFKQ